MAMTRAEINAKSDKKRGVRVQSYKLHEDVIALLAELSSQTGLSKTQIVTQGIMLFAETKKVA
ncbi:ribbon-helix-helix protein, CopG family [Histophilus somni]|uniref:ribbon-helix-helix protein, CopG family n=1 Tax=Histophilus somni TaxID=731 RepID=UPI00094AABE9|nr:ribbon-helix-helix protein, CopG family [Histophilus somni]